MTLYFIYEIDKIDKTKPKTSKMNQIMRSTKAFNINVGLKELNTKPNSKAMTLRKNIIIGLLLIMIYHLNP